MSCQIDEMLHCGKRSLRTLPKAILMGPTGARLWADYLDPLPGFSGSIDFIHKINIPLLFTVTNSIVASYEPCKADWYPSHLSFQYKDNNIEFFEKKFITWDDCAVACQSWHNCGNKTVMLQLATDKSIFKSYFQNKWCGLIENKNHNLNINIIMAASIPQLFDSILLKPGDTIEITIAAAFGIDGLDTLELLKSRVEDYVKDGMSIENIIKNQQQNYEKWFDGVPEFKSDEQLIDKTWMYRWFILRHNLADPAYGNLQHPFFYEGRSHKMSKTPYDPKGWEFTKMIPLSVPMHLLEARWYKDGKYCIGVMDNMISSQDQDGFYHCLYVDRELVSYANFFGWAAYQYYLTSKDKKTMERVLPSLKKQLMGWNKKLGNSNDNLLIDRVHQLTGKEYQPSYWYFSGFPKDCRDKSQITPLKRVDRAVYYYLNALGVAKLCKELGDYETEHFMNLSEAIKKDILDKMWDTETNFFYDLHYENDEKAMVKNIVGFYPYLAKITDERHKKGWEHLFSSEFNTGCPFPSVSADCPVYQAEGGWQGIFIKGRNGCVWDGPTWPYTNSVILDALANSSKSNGHIYDSYFGYFFREFSFLHYNSRDLEKPYLVEHYNSITGEPLSDEVDYNHSYYIDLVVRHIVGLNVEKDRLVLDPVDIGLEHFSLGNIEIEGLKIRITYRKQGTKNCEGDISEGYSLYINECQVLNSKRLERLEYIFP